MASSPVPLAKTNELIDRLRALTASAAIDAAELSDIRDQARHMSKAGNMEIKASGYMISGIVAALDMRIADVDRFFNAAEGWIDAENLPVCRANYLASIHRTAQYSKAAKLWPKLVDAWPDNQIIVELAIDVCNIVLDMDSKKALMKRWRDLGFPGGEDDPNDQLVSAHMKSSRISHDALLERIDVAGSVLRDRGIRTLGVETSFISSGVIIHRFTVPVDVDTAVDLNFAIAEKLADAFEDPFDRAICFGVIPFVEGGK